jgi:hypothetical protein
MHQPAISTVSTTPTSVAAPHVSGDHPDVLSHILDPDVNLGLWQRPGDRTITSELSKLRPMHLADVRCSTSPATFDDDVSRLLQQQGLDAMAFINWRIDLQRLANRCFVISKGRDVSLRLETTADDGCRRFHVDHTHLRLLCTYRGPGTQWLADQGANRGDMHAAPSGDGDFIQATTGEIVLLKGSLWQGNDAFGAIHRSPKPEAATSLRTLVTLDPLWRD